MSWQERAAARERYALERRAVLEQAVTSAGGLLTALKAPPPGDVLYDATRIIPAQGYLQKRFPGDGFRAVAVANYSLNALTVAVDGLQGSPPAQGAGIKTVPAGTFRMMTLRGAALTIYGASGTTFDVTVYARPRDELAAPL